MINPKEPAQDKNNTENNALYIDIKNRIEIIEGIGYDFGPPLNKTDYISIIIVIIICITGLIIGRI